MNNPDAPLSLPDDANFLIYQKEKGLNGTPHFQGYIEFKASKRLTSVKKFLARAHWEPRKGSQEQAIAYSSKEDTRLEGPWTLGEPKQQGQRNDLFQVKEQLDLGMSDSQIADFDFKTWAKHYRAFREYRRIKATPRHFKTKVIFLIGPPGTGKSTYCRQQSPGAYWKPRSTWWDDYNGTDDVIIDDFYGWLPYDLMLRLMDQFPCSVEIKGSTVNFAPKNIYITSNKLPTQWYSENVPFNEHAFTRRLDKIIKFNDLEDFQEFDSWNDFYVTV